MKFIINGGLCSHTPQFFLVTSLHHNKLGNNQPRDTKSKSVVPGSQSLVQPMWTNMGLVKCSCPLTWIVYTHYEEKMLS